MKTDHTHFGQNRLLKTFSLSICALALFFCFFPQKAEARASVSFNFFYDSLDPYGDWVYVEPYGYCWQPEVEYRDWRPYWDGNWVYTDCGWTWVSDEPWGWATYHYGRWVRVHGHQWVWVPGYEWGPGWVSWRYSDAYIGWAPLPPEALWEPGIGFGIGVDLRFDIGPSYYNFCEVRHFGSPRLRSVILASDRNMVIISQTANVTRVVSRNSTVFNGGPDLQAVNRRSSQPIEQLRLARQEDPSASRTARRQGGQLEVFAPTVSPATGAERPATVGAKISKSQIDRGWDAGNPETTQKIRSKYKNDAGGLNDAHGLVSQQVTTGQEQAVPNRKTERSGAAVTERSTQINEAPPIQTEKKAERRKVTDTSQFESRQKAPAVMPATPPPSPSQSESFGQEGFSKQKQKANRQDSQAPSRSERVKETPERSQVVPVPKQERQVREVPPAPSRSAESVPSRPSRVERPSSQAQSERPSKVKEPAQQEAPAKPATRPESDTGGGGGSEKEKHRH